MSVERTHGQHEFETLSTRDIYQGNIFALRSDEVAMPGGRRARREVVEHPGAVVVVALDDRERVALIHQYRYPVGRRLWEIPAGLLDVDGEDPHEAARRELAEEAGLAAAEWSVLVDVASSPGFTDESERVYLARALSEVGFPDASSDEEADLVVRWVPLNEALNMVFAGEIVNAPAVSGLLATRAVLDGAARGRPADAPWPDRPVRFAARKRD